ncbi:MAG TPA: AMP-binding protein [Bryobacterales bacterium]|nr:AMP-binding protein [Bryobacterales bacterium]
MADVHGHSEPGSTSQDSAERLFGVVEELVAELYPGRREPLRITAASRIDRDLAIDSLGRAELLRRIERLFDVSLPDHLLGTAETVGDLLRGLGERAPSGVASAPIGAVSRQAEDAAATPENAETLIDVLEHYSAGDGDRTHVLLTDEGPPGREVTYGELAQSARLVAAGLLDRGVSNQERVALMLPTCAGFFEAFFGSLYAGAVPVPIYPPARMSQLEDHVRRQAAILNNAQARVLITVPEALQVGRLLRGLVPSLEFVGAVEELKRGAPASPVVSRGDDMALLQYTSGSTGDPKGVVLTHRNLLANLRAIGERIEPGRRDTVVSWLPLYHDMGLIGAWLGGLYFAVPLVLMSPLTFLARPEKWLWAIHHHKGTISAAPNFAFELCAAKIEDEQLEGLDLSSLRVLMNGAEPVSASSVRKFTERFGRYGLRPGVIAPVYGMAENSLALAIPPKSRRPLVQRILRAPFAATGKAIAADDSDTAALEIVSCGKALPHHEIRIVDGAGHEIGEREEGRIQFRGPSATAGYFRNEPATKSLMQGGWLDSGDRGYLAASEIYVTGRTKDIIIRAGRNIYPHEIEEAIGEIAGVRKGCVALFGAGVGESGTETVVVVAETRLAQDAHAEIRDAIELLAIELMEARPDEILLVPPHTIPKTSSGKIRRAATRERYENGLLSGGSATIWKQVVSLSLSAARGRLAAFFRGAAHAIYGVYWWLVILGCVAGTWVSLFIARTPGARWKAVSAWGRLILALTFTKATVEGEEHLPPVGGVVAINHASYLDSIVVSALVPGPLSFVVKDDLSGFKLFRSFLERMGALFVQRLDVAASVEDSKKVARAAQAGRRIAVFAEGTFLPRDGLLPFRLGAFQVAAEADTPVIPVALRGTRRILRDGRWLATRGSVRVKILPAIEPQGTEFHEVIRLRDATRAAILPHCGEPDRGDDRLIFTAQGLEHV